MKIYINEQDLVHRGEWEVSSEPIDVTPLQVVKPDMRWSHVDSKGHYHAFSDNKEEQLPTLRRENLTHEHSEDLGDDEVEVWTSIEVVYHCHLCDEKIEPKWDVSTPTHRIMAPGRLSWRVGVRAIGSNCGLLSQLNGQEVSVRVEDDEQTLFGIGLFRVSAGEGGDGPVRLFGDVYGRGPLGVRNKKGNR